MREHFEDEEFDLLEHHPDLKALDALVEEQTGAVLEIDPLPTWQLAADAFPELQAEARQAAVRFLGGVAVRGMADIAPERADVSNESSLMAAIHLAAIGDKTAEKVIYNNAATDVAERLFKAAHQTQITMRVIDGRLTQDKRHLVDIHRNTLEHAVLNAEMLRRTNYELHNALLFEQLHRAGVLRTHDAVVLSPSSTTMTAAEKKAYGLFADTESCSIQRLTAEGDAVTLETAFVAGKRTPSSGRHDLEAIRTMAAMRGLHLETSDGSDVLRHVILVPKTEISGVEDVVSWFDAAAGGTFYGLDKPQENYQTYAASCYKRAEDFDGMVQEIVAQLIREAHTFTKPMDAIMRLDELSEMFSVKRAISDRTLDERVFGDTAAAHIQDARFFMDRGDYERAEQSMSLAQSTAVSGSCPLFKGEGGAGDAANDPDGKDSKEEGAGEKKWGHCPYCKALVLVDPCAAKITCWDCVATVVNGKVISTGNGGTRKRQAEAAARETERQEREAQLATQVDEIFADTKHQPAAAASGALALANA